MSAPTAIEPERTIATLRPSARFLIGPALLFVAVAGLALWLTGLLQDGLLRSLIIVAAIAVVIGACALPFVSWLARRYTITNRKITVQRGLFVRERHELLHSRGYEVSVRRTLWQSVFRCGDVTINTVASEVPLELHDVPNPLLVQAVLQDLIEGDETAAESLVAQHGANTTDATKRFNF